MHLRKPKHRDPLTIVEELREETTKAMVNRPIRDVFSGLKNISKLIRELETELKEEKK